MVCEGCASTFGDNPYLYTLTEPVSSIDLVIYLRLTLRIHFTGMRPSSLTLERGIDLVHVYRKLPIALCIVGRDGYLLAVNDLHAQLSGRPIEDLIGVRVADLNEEGGRNVERDFRAFDAGKTVPNHELKVRDRVYLVSVSPVLDIHGTLAAISVAHIDITEKKAAEKKIERMNSKLEVLSTTDHLTNLHNRRMFDKALAGHCVSLLKRASDFSLLLFDVDHFKAFNDHYGHQAGDQCLRSIADAARSKLRKTDSSIFRYGGEEFAVLVAHADRDAGVAVAERICKAVRRRNIPHEKSAHEIVTISCGVVHTRRMQAPLPVNVGTILLAAADAALYLAKAQGRNTVAEFNTPAEMLSLQQDLQPAV